MKATFSFNLINYLKTLKITLEQISLIEISSVLNIIRNNSINLIYSKFVDIKK